MLIARFPFLWRLWLTDVGCTWKLMRSSGSAVVKLWQQKSLVQLWTEGGLLLSAWHSCSAMWMAELASKSFGQS